jgi:hypothetical protein
MFKTIKNKENIEVNYFSDSDDFNKLLKNNNLDLVYSDVYFDNRIINL